MTREHISIACALNIPMFVAVTKIDICPPNILKQTRQTLAKLLRANGKMPYPIKDMSSVVAAADSIASNRITPVFAMSSVRCVLVCVSLAPLSLTHSSTSPQNPSLSPPPSGLGVDLLRAFVAKVRRSPMRYAPSPLSSPCLAPT